MGRRGGGGRVLRLPEARFDSTALNSASLHDACRFFMRTTGRASAAACSSSPAEPRIRAHKARICIWVGVGGCGGFSRIQSRWPTKLPEGGKPSSIAASRSGAFLASTSGVLERSKGRDWNSGEGASDNVADLANERSAGLGEEIAGLTPHHGTCRRVTSAMSAWEGDARTPEYRSCDDRRGEIAARY